MPWGIRIILLLLLLGATWLGCVAELGVALPPVEAGPAQEGTGHWYARNEFGLNHVFLEGDAFTRGYDFGRFTNSLLLRQEDALVTRMQALIPSRLAQLTLILAAKRWFWGIDTFLDEEWKREMHGVSLSAPARYDYFADPYTRQLAYHGLHEVGQMFVDYGGDGFACTVLAVPNGRHWLVGRNLDFEGGRIFDEEKILKWVTPDHGIPFVSVIWAGMVGAVTGVNARGVYASINAAGSENFARYGIPSTLLLLRVLETAKTTEEAVEILKAASIITTDIFVVAGPNSPFYIVEKSPVRTVVQKREVASAVTNHLTDPSWAGDRTNQFRRDELTSSARLGRANEIVKEIALHTPAELSGKGAAWIAAGLRDKRTDQPGNRSAIDALIATHSVVYDTKRGALYVSTGPSLAGPFLGFDLARSFAEKKPVAISGLGADPSLTPERYSLVKDDIAFYEKLLRAPPACEAAGATLADLRGRSEHYLKYFAVGTVEERCFGVQRARASWQRALVLGPAYASERKTALLHLKGEKP